MGAVPCVVSALGVDQAPAAAASAYLAAGEESRSLAASQSTAGQQLSNCSTSGSRLGAGGTAASTSAAGTCGTGTGLHWPAEDTALACRRYNTGLQKIQHWPALAGTGLQKIQQAGALLQSKPSG
jgi:hypothetical protein